MNKLVFGSQYNQDKKDFLSDEQSYIAIADAEHNLRMGRITPGMHREMVKSQNGKGLFSYRANDDIRIITYEWKQGEILLILVDHHDNAYARVSNIELKIDSRAPDKLPEVIIHEVRQIEYKSACRLHEIPLKKLTDFVGSETVAAKLQLVNDEDELLTRLATIVENQQMRDDLIDLSVAPEKIDAMLARPIAEIKRAPVAQAVKNSENWCLLDDASIEGFFNGTLENWQVFLHPTQRSAVEMTANGPVMITGSAGTGKTVVAVHRAKWLLENVFKNGERILFTTYVKTLIDSVKSMLQAICTPEQLKRIDVINLDTILREEWAHFRPGGHIILQGEKEIADILEKTFSNTDLGISREKLRSFSEEYCDLILELDVMSLEKYQAVVRPRHLGHVDRKKAWKLFELLNTYYRSEDVKETIKSAALNILADAINAKSCKPKTQYAAMIVDEAQDFGAPEYRFFAALTGNYFGNSVPYSLFVCGDGHQRIYRRSGTLKDCGIDVHSRSRCLKVCYRSTQKIRLYAENVIRGVSISDMDGTDERLVDIKSLEIGESPCEHFFCKRDHSSQSETYDARNRFLAERISEWHSHGVHYSDMAVLLRNAGKRWENADDESYLYTTAKALNDLGIPATHVGKKKHSLEGDTVKVMTMHRAKGMQFYGVVINLDGWPYRGRRDANEDQKKANVDQDKCLLYMAIMRATSRVVITGTNGRPEELPVYAEAKAPDAPKLKSGAVTGASGLGVQGSTPSNELKRLFKKDDGTFVDPDSIMTPAEQSALARLPQDKIPQNPVKLTEFLREKMHGRLSAPIDIRGFYRFLKARELKGRADKATCKQGSRSSCIATSNVATPPGSLTNVDEGSRLYLEGLRLMEKEGGEIQQEPFKKAIKCFISGYEKGDLQCWGRLCEMFETEKYFVRLDDTLKERIAATILLRRLHVELPKGGGMLGSVLRTPIDHRTGVAIGSDRHYTYLREKAEKMAERIISQSSRKQG